MMFTYGTLMAARAMKTGMESRTKTNPSMVNMMKAATFNKVSKSISDNPPVGDISPDGVVGSGDGDNDIISSFNIGV